MYYKNSFKQIALHKYITCNVVKDSIILIQGKLIEIIEKKVNICIRQEKIKTHKKLNLLNQSPSLSPT